MATTDPWSTDRYCYRWPPSTNSSSIPPRHLIIWQAALFAKDVTKCAPLLDALNYSVGRVNINSQCQRGPDTLPFTGRKSSALGTLSVSESLLTVSIETVVAAKDSKGGAATMLDLAKDDCNIVTAMN